MLQQRQCPQQLPPTLHDECQKLQTDCRELHFGCDPATETQSTLAHHPVLQAAARVTCQTARRRGQQSRALTSSPCRAPASRSRYRACCYQNCQTSPNATVRGAAASISPAAMWRLVSLLDCRLVTSRWSSHENQREWRRYRRSCRRPYVATTSRFHSNLCVLR